MYGYQGYGYGSIRAAKAPPPPALALDFLSSEVLDARVTASGGTNGTRVNNAGLIVAQACPRYDYDPVTLRPRGVLSEEVRTNVLLQSAAFENVVWALTNATISANVQTSPAGTLTADKFVETAINNFHIMVQQITGAATTDYTLSVYAKASERSWLDLQLDNGAAAWASASFNLSALATANVAGTGAIATITDAGGGWRRLTLKGTSTTTTVRAVAFLNNGSALSYPGDGTSGLYLWGAQLEAGAFATSPIPTVAAAVTRAADVLTMTGTNFSNWFNAAAGTFVVSADRLVAGKVAASQIMLGLDNSTAADNDNSIFIGSQYGGVATEYAIQSGSVTQLDIFETGVLTPRSYGLAYAVNNCAVASGGQAPVVDTSVTLPVGLAILNIGSWSAYGNINQLNGHVRNVAYYASRVSNRQLQALTR